MTTTLSRLFPRFGRNTTTDSIETRPAQTTTTAADRDALGNFREDLHELAQDADLWIATAQGHGWNGGY